MGVTLGWGAGAFSVGIEVELRCGYQTHWYWGWAGSGAGLGGRGKWAGIQARLLRPVVSRSAASDTLDVLAPSLLLGSSHPVRQRSRTRTERQAVRYCVRFPIFLRATQLNFVTAFTSRAARPQHMTAMLTLVLSPTTVLPQQPEMTIF